MEGNSVVPLRSTPAFGRAVESLRLAVRPKARARAEATSVYGPVFVIEDAEVIRIREPLVGTGLPERYALCKNFRFGMQMYPVEIWGGRHCFIARLNA